MKKASKWEVRLRFQWAGDVYIFDQSFYNETIHEVFATIRDERIIEDYIRDYPGHVLISISANKK